MSDPRHLSELDFGGTENRAAAVAMVNPDEKKIGEQHRKREHPDGTTDEHREGEHRNTVKRHAWSAQRDRRCEHTHCAKKQRNDETTKCQKCEAHRLRTHTTKATFDERCNNEHAG